MHEIVTLQFGKQSNYLGTHFWNTQVGGTALLRFSQSSVYSLVSIFRTGQVLLHTHRGAGFFPTYVEWVPLSVGLHNDARFAHPRVFFLSFFMSSRLDSCVFAYLFVLLRFTIS